MHQSGLKLENLYINGIRTSRFDSESYHICKIQETQKAPVKIEETELVEIKNIFEKVLPWNKNIKKIVNRRIEITYIYEVTSLLSE